MLSHAFKKQKAESYGAGIKVYSLHTQQLEADKIEIKVKINPLNSFKFVSCAGFLVIVLFTFQSSDVQ